MKYMLDAYDKLEQYDLTILPVRGKTLDQIIDELHELYAIEIKPSEKLMLMMYFEDKYNVRFQEYKTYKVLF